MCFFCYGKAIKHLMGNATFCYLLLRFAPAKYVHKLVFLFAMSYLSFIQLYRWWFLTSYQIDITGPMMLLVQKVTVLAFSLHDGKVKPKAELNDSQIREAISEYPPLLEYSSYLFNFMSILTGPLCFFVDYLHFIDGTHVTPSKSDHNQNSQLPTPWRTVIEKSIWVLIFSVILLEMTPGYSSDLLFYPSTMRQNIFLWYMTLSLILFVQRVQYYFVWTLADIISNICGLGFSGYDDQGKAKWDLISNVRPYDFEVSLYASSMTMSIACHRVCSSLHLPTVTEKWDEYSDVAEEDGNEHWTSSLHMTISNECSLF